MTREEAAMLVVMYVGFFVVWLPVATWRAFKSQRGKKMWQVAANCMWGGLLMAVAGRYMLGDGVRSIGALVVQAGLLVAMLCLCWSVVSRAWDYSRRPRNEHTKRS